MSSIEDVPPQSSADSGSDLPVSNRVSAALAEVIQEFEEEAEDEIVLLRNRDSVSRPDHPRVVDDTTETSEAGASVRYNSISSTNHRFLRVIF